MSAVVGTSTATQTRQLARGRKIFTGAIVIEGRRLYSKGALHIEDTHGPGQPTGLVCESSHLEMLPAERAGGLVGRGGLGGPEELPEGREAREGSTTSSTASSGGSSRGGSSTGASSSSGVVHTTSGSRNDGRGRSRRTRSGRHDSSTTLGRRKPG